MKLLLCTLILLFFPLDLKAQEIHRPQLEENVYFRALGAVLTARDQDAKSASVKDPLRHVIIMRDIQLNVGFPTRVGDVEIEYLYEDDLRARHRSAKHEIPVFVMRPISNEGNRLVIDFTRYWFSATKKTNMMSLEGGYRVVMVYDCVRKEYAVESAKLWGI
jgi:hypothetical protein